MGAPEGDGARGSEQASPLRVLVVDDSPICRGVLRGILEASGDIVVVGEAADGYSAIESARLLSPDLVTMDLDMPGVDGLETIELLMAEMPVPILVVTGEPVGPGSDLVFEAVNRGALDLLAKPSLSNRVQAEHVRSHVRALARVPVFQRVSAGRITAAEGQGEGELGSHRRFPVATPARAAQFVAIAAGAGGSRAVGRVVRQLPAELPVPVAVAHHLPQGFVDAFAGFLRAHGRLRVEVVGGNAVACAPGVVYLAMDGAHLLCTTDGGLVASADPPVDGYRPSATALFRSAATAYGEASLGVVLSGLGDDGVNGAAAIRDAGGLTIAEDDHARPADMPRAAAARGAVERVIPVQLIADMLVASTSVSPTRQTTPPPPVE